ncbi:MAG: 5-(carboxyamino)imidazole ribonucleotide mutase [Planctomycetota bacterium]|nr:5-(carboxyamino)imidazole ribonucleotide mutase [Planctomycetota bacterium]
MKSEAIIATDSLVKKLSVGVIMGSQSDWETMKHACDVLDQFGVTYEKRVVSAHRTPQWMVEYASTARNRGLKVIIAGAGGAAHLPGMVSSMTTLPVVGVPVQSRALQGLDSLLSIVQMPGGVPVATMAIGSAGATNAGLMAVRILAISSDHLAERLEQYASDRAGQVMDVSLS